MSAYCASGIQSSLTSRTLVIRRRRCSVVPVHVEQWLTRSARRAPERVAIETPGVKLAYAELDRLVGAAARDLAADPGERVAIALPPGIDFVIALHACLRL